jgi:aryl-alcohol dehydrogenase-like predicted oxidoreductase
MRALPDGREISALGFGCSSLWASPGYDESQAQAMLDALVLEGVNHFDTGPSYGAGVGERRLGDFIARRGMSDLVIATKVGTNLIDGVIHRGFAANDMARSFDDSLKRLRTDRVDLLYLHGPSLVDLTSESLDFLQDQKARGRVSWVGVNSFDPRVLERLVDLPIDAVMLQYNVGDFRNAAALDRLQRAGKMVFSGTALARARFAWRSYLPRDRAGLWYLARLLKDDPFAPLRALSLARRMRQAGKPLAEVAAQFVVSDQRVLSSLFGTSRIDHARANARAGHERLDPEIWKALRGA